MMLEFGGITHNPDLFGGKPCLRHLPVPAATILNLLASGRTQEEILQLHPMLRADDLKGALLFAAWRIDEPAALEPPARPVDAAPAPTPGGTQPATGGLPPIVMTRVGIFDRRMGFGIIAWHDIEAITLGKRGNQAAVELEIKKPYRYLARLPQIQRRLTELRLMLRINPFRISPGDSGVSGEELFTNLKRCWFLYRNDPWSTPRDIPEFSSLLERATGGPKQP